MLFENLGIVLVLYYPNADAVKSILLKIKDKAGVIYLIDNTPGGKNLVIERFLSDFTNVKYEALMSNKGIAEAQNVGIKAVFEDLKREYVLLLDQDSEPNDHMIEQLIGSFNKLREKPDSMISAVGALTINKDSNKVYKDRELRKKYVLDSLLHKQEIMSSGSLISRDAIDNIGLMESLLFIDGVDHEWCWRGNRLGYSCFVDENAVLMHKLGSGDKKILWITLAITAPTRCYYQYRNFLILIRRSYVPLNWKIINFIKYLVKAFYYPIFVVPRRLYVKNIFNGIKAGLKNVK